MVKIGEIIEVTITGIQPYGAFALLPDYSTGLIHISEISDGFVKNVENFVHKGEKISVKVIDIDHTTHQAKLSLKAIDPRAKRRDRRHNLRHLKQPIKETPKGFNSLKEMLPIWIEQELNQMEE